MTVVSPNSYFSFTPFLASTAVGTLEFRCATEPVRSLKDVHFAQGWANKIGKFSSHWEHCINDASDFSKKTVEVEPALPPVDDPTKTSLDNYKHTTSLPSNERMDLYNLEYDKLVCAVGCYSASFGIPGVGHAFLPVHVRR